MLHCKKANVCTASRGRRDLSKGWAAGTSEALLPARRDTTGGVRTRSAIVEIWQSAITGRLPAGRLHDLPDRQTLERGQEWDVPGMLGKNGHNADDEGEDCGLAMSDSKKPDRSTRRHCQIECRPIQ